MSRYPTLALLLAFAAVICHDRVTAQEESDKELASQLPRIPATEPTDALSTFRLEAGYGLEIVASEPQVIDPIAMAFDARGRMYVVEMRDYPFTSDKDNLTTSDLARTQPSGRIRLLEDTDRDGKVDRSTVFLDGLHWPTAVACSKGGVYVCASPDILFARDDDGDGVADLREVAYRGFRRRNVQALPNGLRWGVDHKLYGNSGYNGGDIRSVAHPDQPARSVSGRDFRFAPGGAFETIPSAGGQFGTCFDNFGNRFACSNSSHARLAIFNDDYLSRNRWLPSTGTSTLIAIDGGAAPVFRTSHAEPWRIVRTRWRASSKNATRYASTELVPVGFFTSATGLLVFGGDAYGGELRGELLIGDVGGNLVHRKQLEPSGVSFRARRPPGYEKREFLTSTDNWFRPTHLVDGPDGAVYILDMYRETIEHPHSIPVRIKRSLGLTSGNDRGRIYRLVRKGHPPPSRPPPASLDGEGLVAAVESGNAWTRRTAARLIIERGAKGLVEKIRRVAHESRRAESRLVALHTLAAGGSLAPADVLKSLEDEHAQLRRHAVLLAETVDGRTPAMVEALTRLASDADARVRFQVALTLGTLRPPGYARALATIARRDVDDGWTRAALLSSCGEDSALVLAELARDTDFVARAAGARFLASLAEIVGARGHDPTLAATLEIIANDTVSDMRCRTVALSGLGQGLRRRGKTLAALLTSPPAGLRESVGKLATIFESAATRSVATAATTDDRRGAIELLAHAPADVGLDALKGVLRGQEPPALQLAAIRSIGAVEDARSATALVKAWSGMSPSLRREAAEALFRRPTRLKTLLDAIEHKRIGAADLDPARRKQLLDHPDKSVRDRARSVLGTIEEAADEDRLTLIRKALTLEGDLTRGEALFRKTCGTCHRSDGKGHAAGPDIETVRARDAESLLTLVVDPNREVAPNYIVYTAVLRDGRVITGMISGETATSVRLLRGEGASDTILRSELLKIESTGRSLMPDDMGKTLGAQGLADVVSFVRRRPERKE